MGFSEGGVLVGWGVRTDGWDWWLGLGVDRGLSGSRGGGWLELDCRDDRSDVCFDFAGSGAVESEEGVS